MGKLLEGFVSLIEGDEDLLSISELMTEEEVDDWTLLVKCFNELNVSTIGKDLKRIDKFYNLNRWQELSIMALIKLMELTVKEAEEHQMNIGDARKMIGPVHEVNKEYDGSMFG